MFFIGLWYFIMIYITERCVVFYFYRQPPSYDEKMTASTIKLLPFASLIYIMITYWCMSNQQIFANKVYPVSHDN